MLFGELLLLCQVVTLLLLGGRRVLRGLVVLGDHVGLGSCGLRLGLVGLKLVLAGQVGLLRAEQTCWASNLAACRHATSLAFDEHVWMRLSP